MPRITTGRDEWMDRRTDEWTDRRMYLLCVKLDCITAVGRSVARSFGWLVVFVFVSSMKEKLSLHFIFFFFTPQKIAQL